jgi:hypothetical protein
VIYLTLMGFGKYNVKIRFELNTIFSDTMINYYNGGGMQHVKHLTLMGFWEV